MGCQWASGQSVSLLPAIQATGLPIVTPAGLTPAGLTSLFWTHNGACGFPALRFHEGALLGRRPKPRPAQVADPETLLAAALPTWPATGWRARAIPEWPSYASVGPIQLARLLGRGCTGISQKELIHLPALTSALALPPNRLRRPPSPTHSGRRWRGHAAFAALEVLLGRPTTRPAPLPISLTLIGSLLPVPPGNPTSPPGVTSWSSVPCRPQTP
jgi:hypothetical protein